jgi:hypothetical protein
MHFELDDYNNEDYIKVCIKWCHNIKKLGGSMIDIMVNPKPYTWMRPISIYTWCIILEGACRGWKCQWIHPTQRDWNLSLVVVAHDVTLWCV